MTVIPTAQLIDDINGRVLYRRYRTCTNTDCEFYLIRRISVEVLTPLTEDVCVVSPYLNNLKSRRLPRRTAPLPDIAPALSEP